MAKKKDKVIKTQQQMHFDFIDAMTKRCARLRKTIVGIGAASNSAVWDYKPEDVETIVTFLETAIEEMRQLLERKFVVKTAVSKDSAPQFQVRQ